MRAFGNARSLGRAYPVKSRAMIGLVSAEMQCEERGQEGSKELEIFVHSSVKPFTLLDKQDIS